MKLFYEKYCLFSDIENWRSILNNHRNLNTTYQEPMDFVMDNEDLTKDTELPVGFDFPQLDNKLHAHRVQFSGGGGKYEYSYTYKKTKGISIDRTITFDDAFRLPCLAHF